MARVAAVVPDLMLQSRVVELLRSAGHEVSIAADPSSIEPNAELVVADVGVVPPEKLTAAGVPVLGFHQHTDPDSAVAAKEAGVVIVVPRSRMVRDLPQLVEKLLSS